MCINVMTSNSFSFTTFLCSIYMDETDEGRSLNFIWTRTGSLPCNMIRFLTQCSSNKNNIFIFHVLQWSILVKFQHHQLLVLFSSNQRLVAELLLYWLPFPPHTQIFDGGACIITHDRNEFEFCFFDDYWIVLSFSRCTLEKNRMLLDLVNTKVR